MPGCRQDNIGAEFVRHVTKCCDEVTLQKLGVIARPISWVEPVTSAVRPWRSMTSRLNLLRSEPPRWARHDEPGPR